MSLKKYRMIFNENTCIGCQSCSVACRVQNDVPDDVFRLQVRVETKGTFPNLMNDFSRQSCVMCEDAPCVTVCPTEASFQTADGIVDVHDDLCISCKYCIIACPYGARFINPVTKAADKCNFCRDTRLDKDLDPACVTVCPTDALVFGDMNDKNSEVYKTSQKNPIEFPKEYLGTKPTLVTIPNKKRITYE